MSRPCRVRRSWGERGKGESTPSRNRNGMRGHEPGACGLYQQMRGRVP